MTDSSSGAAVMDDLTSPISDLAVLTVKERRQFVEALCRKLGIAPSAGAIVVVERDGPRGPRLVPALTLDGALWLGRVNGHRVALKAIDPERARAQAMVVDKIGQAWTGVAALGDDPAERLAAIERAIGIASAHLLGMTVEEFPPSGHPIPIEIASPPPLAAAAGPEPVATSGPGSADPAPATPSAPPPPGPAPTQTAAGRDPWTVIGFRGRADLPLSSLVHEAPEPGGGVEQVQLDLAGTRRGSRRSRSGTRREPAEAETVDAATTVSAVAEQPAEPAPPLPSPASAAVVDTAKIPAGSPAPESPVAGQPVSPTATSPVETQAQVDEPPTTAISTGERSRADVPVVEPEAAPMPPSSAASASPVASGSARHEVAPTPASGTATGGRAKGRSGPTPAQVTYATNLLRRRGVQDDEMPERVAEILMLPHPKPLADLSVGEVNALFDRLKQRQPAAATA